MCSAISSWGESLLIATMEILCYCRGQEVLLVCFYNKARIRVRGNYYKTNHRDMALACRCSPWYGLGIVGYLNRNLLTEGQSFQTALDLQTGSGLQTVCGQQTGQQAGHGQQTSRIFIIEVIITSNMRRLIATMEIICYCRGAFFWWALLHFPAGVSLFLFADVCGVCPSDRFEPNKLKTSKMHKHINTFLKTFESARPGPAHLRVKYHISARQGHYRGESRSGATFPGGS